MFDIGFIEMLVIGLILLLVVGPERLPEVARTVGGWVHQAKQYMDGMKSELDRDLNWSEMQRETREGLQAVDRETREATDLSASGSPGEAPANGSPGSETPGGEQPTVSGMGETEGAGQEGPSPEEQAAADMERELEQEDERDHQRDGKERG
jgi:sec-independent protein translocase protein TatB